MPVRSRAAVEPVASLPSLAFVQARKALDQAARLQRAGDLVGAIELCRQGIALGADAQDKEGVRLRILLRVRQESASRLHRRAACAD